MTLGSTEVASDTGVVAPSVPSATRPPIGRLPGERSTRYIAAVWFIRIGIIAAFFGVWQRLGTSSPYWALVVTSPTKIASQLWTWLGEGRFWSDLQTTLTEAGVGYVVGVVSAILAVAIIAPVPILDRFIRPFIAASNALPKVVLAPLFIVWFGIGLRAKVYFVASFIFFIVFYGVYTSVKSINKDLLDNTRALGASKGHLVRHVYLPAMATWVFSSLRIGIPFSILGAVFAEYLGGAAGIGVRIAKGQQQLRNQQVMAGVVVLGLVALVLDRVLVRLEKRLGRWRGK